MPKLAGISQVMLKFNFARSWESTIAVLEDNIFLTDAERWDQAISDIVPFLRRQPLLVNEERRKEPRFSLSLPVHHRIQGIHLKWRRSMSLDVSQNGIRLALEGPVKVGTRLELNIKLPNQDKRVKLNGVVIWEKPSINGNALSECGVAFQNLRYQSKRERLIHFMADRLCRMAMNQSQDLTCRIASSREDLTAAYRLVYNEYVLRGYCKPHPSELHYNFFCLLPGSRTFLLEKAGTIVGTVSLIPDSFWNLPMSSLFEDKIARFRKPGSRLAEIGLLALDHHLFGKRSFALTDFRKLAGSFKLFKIMFDYARFEGKYTDLLIAMHPKHKDLYHYLMFDSVGPVRSYENAEGNPALPMRMDVAKAIATVPRNLSICRYYVDSLLAPDTLKPRMTWNAKSLTAFLKDLRPLWSELKPEHQDYLKICYPEIPL